MISIQGVKGILFDSGDTLMGPIGGEWLPGPAFRRIVAERNDLKLNWTVLDTAHQAATNVLLENHLLHTVEEELDRYQGYFTSLLLDLGMKPPVDELAREIARETIEHPSVELFPDVRSALERFARDGLKLGVISNGWPSLGRQLRLLGVREFFDVLVVSAHVGSRKPDEEIFRHALEAMDLPPESVLLVDDALENVVAAGRLGMPGVVVTRGPVTEADDTTISSLADLVVTR